MAKILMVYPPFATPASPPYSITYLATFLNKNLPEESSVEVLDLNIIFHEKKFGKYGDFCRTLNEKYSPEEYDKLTKEYNKETSVAYSENNNKVVEGGTPEYFDEILQEILDKKPDHVAFSIVFSSQAFYAFALIKKLEEMGISTIAGGPAVNIKIKEVAGAVLANEVELLEYVGEKVDHDSLDCSLTLDFSGYDLKRYFVPETVIPLKTASTCFYQMCAFCTHHGGAHYFEYSLDDLEKTIKDSKAKNVFIVDDMISKKRLLLISKIMKSLGVKWMCQLRPTKDLDHDTLKTLKESGLNVIIWGVESGNDRVLKKMRKGTNKEDIKKVLDDSHAVGIQNVTYIMFGFPSETKDEAYETIEFLKENSDNIDLISMSIFGLQSGTPIFNDPEEYGIVEIQEIERTILEPRYTYTLKDGLTQVQARKFRNNHMRTIEKINNFPRSMNFFREHMLCLTRP